jgi:beta-lactamase class A
MATYKYLYPKAQIDEMSEYDQEVRVMMTVSDNDSFERLLNDIDTWMVHDLAARQCIVGFC